MAVKSGRQVQTLQRRTELPTGVEQRGSEGSGGRSGSLSSAIETQRRAHSCGSSCTVYNLVFFPLLLKVFTERAGHEGGAKGCCQRPGVGSESGNYLKLLNSRHKFNLKIVERAREQARAACCDKQALWSGYWKCNSRPGFFALQSCESQIKK